jgi:23S rRNA (adenine2030-N6)-methyltransferase
LTDIGRVFYKLYLMGIVLFSYRHSFHAGNHADVLKHLTQLALLNSLKQKSKPFSYFDTHAGAGIYDLKSDEAKKTGEHQQGIGRIIGKQVSSSLTKQYLDLVGHYYDRDLYPGSPTLALSEARAEDKITLMEWHNTEIGHLKRHLSRHKNVGVHHRDGFEGLLAMLPPKPARGLVLIDPPYERVDEYQQVIDTVAKANKKWPQGIIAVWYPLIIGNKNNAPKLLEGLSRIPCKSQFALEMEVMSKEAERGMYGSGVCIINPPWQIEQELEPAVNELMSYITDNNHICCHLNWLVKED